MSAIGVIPWGLRVPLSSMKNLVLGGEAIEPGKSYRVDLTLSGWMDDNEAAKVAETIFHGLRSEGFHAIGVKATGDQVTVAFAVLPGGDQSLIVWEDVLIAILPKMIIAIVPMIIVGYIVSQWISGIPTGAWAIFVGFGCSVAVMILANAVTRTPRSRSTYY